MFGVFTECSVASMPEDQREFLKKAYGQFFLEAFSLIGRTHKERGEAIGVTFGSASDRARGKSLPDPITRAWICLAVQALREKATDEERRGLVERGLKLMRDIEEENGEKP